MTMPLDCVSQACGTDDAHASANGQKQEKMHKGHTFYDLGTDSEFSIGQHKGIQQKANEVKQAAQFIAAGYFPNYPEHWHACLREDTPFSMANRMYIPFGNITQNRHDHYTVTFTEDEKLHTKALLTRIKKENPAMETFLTVSGSNVYPAASQDERFAPNVLAMLTEYGFTGGFDIDWEVNIEQSTLNALAINLNTALKAAGFMVTLDGLPECSSQYDMQTLSENLDQINLMSYGPTINLGALVDQYTSAGFPISKLIAGVTTDLTSDWGVDTLGPEGTINLKMQYVQQNGMAGGMSWDWANDYCEKEHPNYPTFKGAKQMWESLMNSSKFV